MTKIDVLDAQGKKTGESLTKPEIHVRGLWHGSSHVWFYNKSGDIFFQKRALVKDSHAGLLDITAAGHIDSGESADEAALRELSEELGLSVKLEDLEKIGVLSSESYISDAKWNNKEFYNIYLYNFTGDIRELVLQVEEVDSILAFNLKELVRTQRYLQSDFVPHKSEYFEFVFGEIKKRIGDA